MPNVANYQSKSLRFTGYYNHTFATYRGLIGQLYSGYQLSDFDSNSLISVQSILADEGYDTCFINTEPDNDDFSEYLNNMNFNEVIGDDYECNGMADSISDGDAYGILFDEAINKYETGNPFFIAIYTFGTHASLDSTEQLFGDGSSAELNKFYDADYQFGEFMEKFINSPLYDNTIVVFTAYHATYQEASFNEAFSDYTRQFHSIDEIPFFIYHKEVEPSSISVSGRNTLDFAPTILDYIDVSAPNYFIGSRLFCQQAQSVYEAYYNDSFVSYSTANCMMVPITGSQLSDFEAYLTEYYITKK